MVFTDKITLYPVTPLRQAAILIGQALLECTKLGENGLKPFFIQAVLDEASKRSHQSLTWATTIATIGTGMLLNGMFSLLTPRLLYYPTSSFLEDIKLLATQTQAKELVNAIQLSTLKLERKVSRQRITTLFVMSFFILYYSYLWTESQLSSDASSKLALSSLIFLGTALQETFSRTSEGKRARDIRHRLIAFEKFIKEINEFTEVPCEFIFNQPAHVDNLSVTFKVEGQGIRYLVENFEKSLGRGKVIERSGANFVTFQHQAMSEQSLQKFKQSVVEARKLFEFKQQVLQLVNKLRVPKGEIEVTRFEAEGKRAQRQYAIPFTLALEKM